MCIASAHCGSMPQMWYTFTVIAGLTEEASKLVSSAVSTLALVPGLCAPSASVTVLPSVLYLLTCVLREVALVSVPFTQATVSATLQALKILTASQYTRNGRCSGDWVELLQRCKLNFWIFSQKYNLL